MSEQRTTSYDGLWVPPEEDPRPEGNPQGEKATYEEYLARYRMTLEMKCDGLTPEQLASRSVPPSTLSLLGLVRHMAHVEHAWFQRVAQATGEAKLYWSPEDHDLEFNGVEASSECVEDAFASWRREIAKAEEWFAAVPEEDLGRELTRPGHQGAVVSIRDMMVHMIEEYARHCGHADLLRETIDGRTGQ